MKRKVLLIAVLAAVSSFVMRAQEGIDIGYVSMINLGDGRIYCSDLISDTPLQGTRKIIDGRKSEYKQYDFTDGLYDGAYYYYRNNKLVEEGTYSKGYKDGVFKEYYSDGTTVKRSKSYRGGKLDGMDVSYYTNGRKEREKGYKENVEHGPERRWDHESGTLITEKNYSDGKLHGPQMELVTSNVSSYVIRSNYNMGLLDGEYSEVFTDGVVRKKGRYENGKLAGELSGNDRSLTDDGNVKTKKKK